MSFARKGSRDLAQKVAGIAPGTEIRLGIIRDGKEETVSLKARELADKGVKRARAMPETQGGVEELGLRVAPARLLNILQPARLYRLIGQRFVAKIF
jgi:serine protease Do